MLFPLILDASEEDYKSLPADLQDEEVIPRVFHIIEFYLDLYNMLNSCVQVPLLDNIHWKELSVLMYVWVAFLIVQILKVVNIWFFL